MSKGLDDLKHIVVLMMENRSFDHMLGGLKKKFPKISGLNGDEWNPDINGKAVKVQPSATYQGQLDHDPDHHFPGVDLQIFGGTPAEPGRAATMRGFIKSYATQGATGDSSHAIMNYFAPERIPTLTTLATEFAVFNGWFSSIPGPTICNRAFAHYGTSFGNVDMNLFLVTESDRAKIPTIYERMEQGGQSAKLYYYDQPSSTMEIVNLVKDQSFFGTYDEFVADCRAGKLPQYSFIEPNYSDHPGPGGGQLLANDQHPDHHVLAGDRFIAGVYNQIRINPDLWKSTLLLIVYDEHGGLYDHVVPPNCTPDGFTAAAAATGTGFEFKFDRLGIRVPAILVSPYIARGTVVPGIEDPANQRIFEHASIPATVTKGFLPGNDKGVGASTIRPIYERLNMGVYGEINGRAVDIRPSHNQPSPSIEQIYSAATAPGLDHQPFSLQLGAGVRVRPTALNSLLHFNYDVSYRPFFALSDSNFSFQRLTIDLYQEISLHHTNLRVARDTNGPNDCLIDPSADHPRCPKVSVRNVDGSLGLRVFSSLSMTPGGDAVPFYFQPTLGGVDINGNNSLSSYQDYRFRGPNILLLRENFEHSIGKLPLGVALLADQAKLGLTRGDIASSPWIHSYAAGLTLRAGGFPQVYLLFAFGGKEGTHTIANMNTSLLGGSARPSLF